MVEVPEALGPGRSHELGYQGTDRSRDTGQADRVHGYPQIFVMQIDPEPWIERARQHRRCFSVEYPAAGKAASQYLQRERAVDVACVKEHQCFGDECQCATDDHLVGGLDGLPGSRRPDVHDRRAEALEYRQRTLEGLRRAAHHDRQRGLDCTLLPA